MITIKVDMKVAPSKRNEFMDVMLSLHNTMIKEKGIRGSSMRHDKDRTISCLIYEWETEEDFKEYCHTENFRVFLGALKTLCSEANVTYWPICMEGEGKKIWDICSEEAQIKEN